MTWRRIVWASPSRPACSCSVASCINCAMRWASVVGCSGGVISGPDWPNNTDWPDTGRPAAGIAPSSIIGRIAAPSALGPVSASVKRITEAGNHRFEDRGCRLQLLQVVAIAVARAVGQLFGHLGIACGARIPAVLVESEAALVERLADEIEHAPGRG